MTPEQRLDRAEWILVRMAKSGREARSEFRQKINILIDAQIKNEAAWRAESHELNEKINILIHSQMNTNEQIKNTDEQIKALAASQMLTDQALRAFINSLRKRGNGTT